MSRLTFPPGGELVVNLADVLPVGAADQSAALRAVIETNGPGHIYRIPDGMTVNLPLQLGGTAPRLRNHVYIEGEGPGSVISVSGYAANPGSSYYAIGLDSAYQVEDVAGAGISNLTILGDGPGAAQTWTNRQARAISITGATFRKDDLVFRDVVFENHDGIPIQADGGRNVRFANIERCQFINNGNGLNFNGDFCTVRDCYFTNCEGIENAGAGNVIEGNIFLNVFAVAISSGGDTSQGASEKSLPGTRIVNNQVFGVLGGTGYGTGTGIVTAQSSPDQLIAGNYVERTYSYGIQLAGDALSAPPYAWIVAHNHLVNCGNPGAGGAIGAIYANYPNGQIIGNHIYNRAGFSADPYPLGASITRWGIQIGANNIHLADNVIDTSNGGQYCIAFSGSPTGLTAGKNALTPAAGYAGWAYTQTRTFTDASALPAKTVSGGAFSNPPNPADNRIMILSAGSNQSNTLMTAVGWAGLSQTYINTSASFTWALTPNGTEKINNVAATKTLGAGYSAMTLTSDGANWLMTDVVGTVS